MNKTRQTGSLWPRTRGGGVGEGVGRWPHSGNHTLHFHRSHCDRMEVSDSYTTRLVKAEFVIDLNPRISFTQTVIKSDHPFPQHISILHLILTEWSLGSISAKHYLASLLPCHTLSASWETWVLAHGLLVTFKGLYYLKILFSYSLCVCLHPRCW